MLSNCATSFDCYNCPIDFSLFISDEEDGMVVAAAQQYDSWNNRPYRVMSKDFLPLSLEEMRRKMIQNVNYSPTMLPVNILTRLSDKLIKNIVSKAHYFFTFLTSMANTVNDESEAESLNFVSEF